MRPNNWQVIVGGVAGTATSFASSSCWAMDIVRLSYQVVVSSGSVAGTFVVQGSNDKSYGQGGVPVGQYIPTNWNTIGSSTTIICSTTATSKVFLAPATEVCYEHVRFVFTDASAGSALGLFDIRAKTLGL